MTNLTLTQAKSLGFEFLNKDLEIIEELEDYKDFFYHLDMNFAHLGLHDLWEMEGNFTSDFLSDSEFEIIPEYVKNNCFDSIVLRNKNFGDIELAGKPYVYTYKEVDLNTSELRECYKVYMAYSNSKEEFIYFIDIGKNVREKNNDPDILNINKRMLDQVFKI